MKKLLYILFIFITNAVFAQQHRPSSYTAAVMTTDFSDSLKKNISNVITADYTIKLAYWSTISAEGKLLKPLITREVADGTVDDNDFVQKMKVFITNAPAWKPAFDHALNKKADDFVFFSVEIKRGKITVVDMTNN